MFQAKAVDGFLERSFGTWKRKLVDVGLDAPATKFGKSQKRNETEDRDVDKLLLCIVSCTYLSAPFSVVRLLCVSYKARNVFVGWAGRGTSGREWVDKWSNVYE